MMLLSEFVIGMEFWTATGKWMCTDVGTRTVVAVAQDDSDGRMAFGPPYPVPESVFSEEALQGCAPTPPVLIFQPWFNAALIADLC